MEDIKDIEYLKDEIIKSTKIPKEYLVKSDIDHELLKKVWSMNTSGNGRFYYSANIDGIQYEGERDWDSRWNLIKDCIDWKDKSVLEFGCNAGISLTYLIKYRHIKYALGIERPNEQLIQHNLGKTVDAAFLLQEAFGIINKYDILQIDLNANKDYYTVGYEKKLFDKQFPYPFGEHYDPNNVCIAMSILKWIEDKERFLDYLSCFKYVIYEGHDSDEVEIKRFTDRGFSYNILGKTQIGKSYKDDDTRTVILFTKL